MVCRKRYIVVGVKAYVDEKSSNQCRAEKPFYRTFEQMANRDGISLSLKMHLLDGFVIVRGMESHLRSPLSRGGCQFSDSRLLIRLQKASTGDRMTRRQKSKVKKNKTSKTKKANIDLATLSALSSEEMLSDLFGDIEEKTPLKEAQDLMYDAWEVTDPKRRVALARKANQS